MPTIDYAMSLGTNCRAKYHLHRRFGAGAASSVFDWQLTPPAAVLSYLAGGFEGTFDAGDLYFDEARRVVVNRRFLTIHEHEFTREWSPDWLETQYPTAHDRHRYLCSKTRQMLGSGMRLLVVISHPKRRMIPPELVSQIRIALAAFGRPNRLELIEEPEDGDTGEDWKGNHDVWSTLLEPYTLSNIERRSRS